MAKHTKVHISDNNFYPYIVLFSVYVVGMVYAVIHSIKLTQIGPITIDAGMIIYATTYALTDIVTEIYGKRYAKKMVWGSIIGLITAYVFTQLSFALPASSEWQHEHEFNTVFDMGLRVFIAGLITLMVSQLLDIFVYSRIKAYTGEKMLWLRNNCSTIAGGIVNALIFYTIAFYGVFPIGEMILFAMAISIIVALCDTPLVYLAVYIMHKIHPEMHGDVEN